MLIFTHLSSLDIILISSLGSAITFSTVLSLKTSRNEELIGKHILRFTQFLVKAGRITMENASITEYVPMIREVTIENFKGIKHCEIKDLAKINLFIGRNSCGKSSIMEAIYFTGKEFIESSLPLCIQRRSNRSGVSARELWYGYLMNSNVNVKLGFNEQDYTEMRIQFSPTENRVLVYLGSGSPTSKGGMDLLCAYNKSGFGLVTGRRAIDIISPHLEQIRYYFENSIFIDPTIKTDMRSVEGKYLNLVKLDEETSSDLVKRTAEIYGTEPSWEFLPHPDFSSDTPSRFTILEGKRRLFLDNFGDGLHYGLAMLAIAKTRNNTALFIEEIESHQHAEAIKNLISALLEIARKNNLQLFITSHNQSVWNYLYYDYKSPEERKEEFRCFLIVKDKDSGEVEATIEEGLSNIQPELNGRPQ
jgi:hypothetical protein